MEELFALLSGVNTTTGALVQSFLTHLSIIPVILLLSFITSFLYLPDHSPKPTISLILNNSSNNENLSSDDCLSSYCCNSLILLLLQQSLYLLSLVLFLPFSLSPSLISVSTPLHKIAFVNLGIDLLVANPNSPHSGHRVMRI